jgi:hypothetical protein
MTDRDRGAIVLKHGLGCWLAITGNVNYSIALSKVEAVVLKRTRTSNL